MGFSYNREYSRFIKNWQELERILLETQTSNEVISEVFALSLEQFNKDRRYYTYKLHSNIPDHPLELIPENESAYLKGLLQTDNQYLFKELQSLSKTELQVILMSFEKDMTLKEISIKLKQKYSTTTLQFHRAKKKLKKFL